MAEKTTKLHPKIVQFSKQQLELNEVSEDQIARLFQQKIDEGTSANYLSKLIGVSCSLLIRHLKGVGVKTPTATEGIQRLWQNEEFRSRKLAATQQMWEDPEFRAKKALATQKQWEDPEFVRKQADAVHQLWQNPQFLEAHRERTQQLWNDPEFRARNAEANRIRRADPHYREALSENMILRWQSHDYRVRQSEKNQDIARKNWLDPNYRQLRSEQTRQSWQDEQIRLKRIAGIKAHWDDPQERELQSLRLLLLWNDPEFRARNIAPIIESWQDPFIREKRIAATKALWTDEKFRKTNAEAKREARLNPDNLYRYYLPTIAGFRTDIGYAQSTWEANIARIILYSKREFERYVRLDLILPDYAEVSMNLDFLTLDHRGRLVGYEIMAHPLENPIGWLKIEQAIYQYPEITFRVIDHNIYRQFEKSFRSSIDNSSQFVGWETSKENLKTHPERFG